MNSKYFFALPANNKPKPVKVDRHINIDPESDPDGDFSDRGEKQPKTFYTLKPVSLKSIYAKRKVRAKCIFCNYASNSQRDVNKHELVHFPQKPLKCNECDFSTRHESSLLCHKRIHSGEKPYRCDECFFSTRTATGLKRHKRLHSDEKPYQCDQCDFSTKYSESLKTHQSIHSKKKLFQCSLCNYSTCFQPSLKNHKRVHSVTSKRYQCDRCDFEAKNKEDLSLHKFIHYGAKSTSTCRSHNPTISSQNTRQRNKLKRRKVTRSSEKTFQCAQCDYFTQRKSDLNKHILIHTSEKRFQCQQCEFFTRKKCLLKYHELIHLARKVFRCDKCDYTTVHEPYLTRHQLTHSGEKLFDCPKCDFSSQRRANLIRHKRTHNGSVKKSSISPEPVKQLSEQNCLSVKDINTLHVNFDICKNENLSTSEILAILTPNMQSIKIEPEDVVDWDVTTLKRGYGNLPNVPLEGTKVVHAGNTGLQENGQVCKSGELLMKFREMKTEL